MEKNTEIIHCISLAILGLSGLEEVNPPTTHLLAEVTILTEALLFICTIIYMYWVLQMSTMSFSKNIYTWNSIWSLEFKLLAVTHVTPQNSGYGRKIPYAVINQHSEE